MTEVPIVNCEQALRLLATYLDGELGEVEYQSIEKHLRTCRSCYSRAEFERRLKTQLGELRREDIGPAFEERIRELIAQFTSVPADGLSAGDPG